MIVPMIVIPEAEDDLADAKEWYDARRPGLGGDFLLRVDEVFARRNPNLRPEMFQGLRVALIRRFPFAVVNRLDDSQITIGAMYHTRSDPRGWPDRSP